MDYNILTTTTHGWNGVMCVYVLSELTANLLFFKSWKEDVLHTFTCWLEMGLRSFLWDSYVKLCSPEMLTGWYDRSS